MDIETINFWIRLLIIISGITLLMSLVHEQLNPHIPSQQEWEIVVPPLNSPPSTRCWSLNGEVVCWWGEGENYASQR